jgi:hypothetical protein
MANFPDKWQKLLKLMEQTRISELYRMTICLWSESDLKHHVDKCFRTAGMRKYLAKPPTGPAIAPYESRPENVSARWHADQGG